MDTLSYKTISANKGTVERKWLLIDAEGQVVGRLASQVATLLRGKHKPSFTPHVDGGDYVVIVNADKVKFTGNKWKDKLYTRHTGYPGGLRQVTAEQMLAKKPERIIEMAVKRMLPKNKLASKMMNHLHIYPGSEHPHEAQSPEVYELKYS